MINLITPFSRSAFRAAVLFSFCLAMSSAVQAADYNYNTGAQVLEINLGTNESLTVTVSGADIVFTLNAGTFSQAGTNTATGDGTIAITVPAGTVATSLTVNDTGVGVGTNDVTFSGSSSISTGTLAIDISGAGVGTVSFTGGFDVSVSTEMDIATNRNIRVGSGSQLTATGTAPILLEANKQATPTSGDFTGIELSGATVESTGSGTLTLNGRGGDTGNNQTGVQLSSAAQVNGGSGTVTVMGTGGASTGTDNYGVYVFDTNSRISSSGGAVLVTGQGGGAGASRSNYGVYVRLGSEITAGGSGTVTVMGTGGADTDRSNFGVYVRDANSRISSSGGAVLVTGTGGGAGASVFSLGVVVAFAGEITAGGMGTVAVMGTGGAGSGRDNHGVFVSGANARISSSGGEVLVTGQGGGSGTSVFNYGVLVNSASEITAGSSGTVTVTGTGGAGTGTDNYGVFVSDANSRISSSTGAVLVTGTSGNGAADIITQLGGAIISTSAGITLNSTTNGTWPNTAGADVSTSSTQTTAFSAGSKLNIDIDGTTPNTNYKQLGVVGMIDLTGVELTFNGSTHTPTLGESFVIVDNDGTDPTSGTFTGLPEGAIISGFLGSGLDALITYVGGDGNDVVLTVQAPLPDYTITTTGNAIIITDMAGNGDVLEVTESGGNINFAAAGRTYSLDGGPTTSLPVDVPLASATSITINAAAGADVINVGDFTTSLPSLTINGGMGDDVVNMNGDITFATDANLDLDLQNDDAAPGTDQLTVAASANLILAGTGAATIKVSRNVIVNTGGSIETVDGNLTVEANQQATPTSGDFIGIELTGATVESTGSGTLTLNGRGGDTGINQMGVQLSSAAQVNGGSGTVTVTGTGGVGTRNENFGVFVTGANSRISSPGGAVLVTGQGGGSGTSQSNFGVWVRSAGEITAGGSGTVTVTGTGGAGTGGSNLGVFLNSRISSSGGEVLVTGQGGGAGASGSNYGVLVQSGEITAGSSGTVTVTGTGGNGAADIIMESGGVITSTSTSAGITLNSTTNGTWPNTAGTDVSASSTQKTAFSAGSKLNIDIDGTTPNTNYKQLGVVGMIDLTGVELTFNGSTHTPTLGESFVIVDNDGTDPTSGTFTGLPEGAIISGFLGSGLDALITYVGDDGNDVVLTVQAPLPDYTITTAGNTIIITDMAGNGDVLEVIENGGNINFAAAGRTYSLDGGPTTSLPVDVPLASATSITINAEAGADVINVGAFTTSLPSLTINGGTGDDVVNMNGDITFATDANLDLDLQNDDAAPGTDQLTVATGANLMLSGTGAATIKVSRNVIVNTGGSIETVVGNLTVEANQQATPTSGDFIGIQLTGATVESTGSGTLTLNGRGGDTGNNQTGVQLVSAAQVNGGSGTVTVMGTGGASPGTNNYGVYVVSSNSRISSSGGEVLVTGQGGGAGTSGFNYGVFVLLADEITAGGSGTVTVTGTGGAGSGNSNYGVFVLSNSRISSSGGAVTVTGQGGGSGASRSNFGVLVQSAGEITAGGSGTVTVTGTGGAGSGDENLGVYVGSSNARISSSGGEVLVTGQGGGAGASGSNYGVLVVNAGEITAGGSGTVTVTGTGGAGTGNSNFGVYVLGTNARINSSGGEVLVMGQGGGAGASVFNLGVVVQSAGEITAGGSGTVTVTGTGGAGSGFSNFGVYVLGTNARINSSGGEVTVTGQGGNGAADIIMESGGAITSTSTSAGITLNSTTNGTWPNTAGTDVSTAPTQKTVFSAGSKLNIDIDGTTPNTDYQQLGVVGMIDLSGVELTFNGSTHTPTLGESFVIVDNDGTDAISGTFTGLAEGATIPNFLGSGLDALITYVGGDGNDVVLTVQAPIILPVSWLEFTARRFNKAALLDWTIIDEVNHDRFTVEWSTDGRQFTTLATVSDPRSRSDNGEIAFFQFAHQQPASGLNYYRIRQHDYDGTTSLSEVRSVTFNATGPGIRVFPNPASDRINIALTDQTETQRDGSILSVNGQLLRSFSIPATTPLYELSIRDLPQGVYLLRIGENVSRFVKK